VVLVSHRLEEVTTIADRVTVLRDGRVVCAGDPIDGRSHDQLARQILGRELVAFSRTHPEPSGERAPLELRGLTGAQLRGVDLDVRPGEVVGLTGRPEAGHDELPLLLAGDTESIGRKASGRLVGSGRSIRLGRHRPAGVAVVPADRVRSGLAVTESACANVSLPRLRRQRLRWLLRSSWQRTEFARAVDLLNIRPADPSLPAGSFSGGNQQKLLLAKWLLDQPELLVLHEPTQAVDVGARADILHAISAAAAAGVAVLISSIEAEDLALICDRVLVLDDGIVADELSAPLDPDRLAESVATLTRTPQPTSEEDPSWSKH
jgi:ribose transport system ATP-binding protein